MKDIKDINEFKVEPIEEEKVLKELEKVEDNLDITLSVQAKHVLKSFLRDAVSELVEAKVNDIVLETLHGAEMEGVIEDTLQVVMNRAMDEVMGNMKQETFDAIKSRQKHYEERKRLREENERKMLKKREKEVMSDKRRTVNNMA